MEMREGWGKFSFKTKNKIICVTLLHLLEKAWAVSEVAPAKAWCECGKHEHPPRHERNHLEQDLHNIECYSRDSKDNSRSKV